MNEIHLLTILYVFIGIPFLFTVEPTKTKIEKLIRRILN